MRTMVILALACLLVLPWAAPAPRDPGSMITPEGCDTIYTCFVPSWCTETTVPDIASSSVVLAKKIFPECPALIKFYKYADYWMHVWIESPTDQEPVEYIQKDDSVNKAVFSCKKNVDDVLEGSYVHDKTVKAISKAIPPKVQCRFDVKLKLGKKVLDVIAADTIQMNTHDGITDVNGPTVIPTILGCDPSKLEYNTADTVPTKVYDKVKFEPGRFYCENQDFKMEYRAENTDVYQPNANLDCRKTVFYVNNDKKINYVDIRCVDDAKFYCNYEVKPKSGETALVLTAPDANLRKEGKLECPTTHPHLIAKGNYISNPKIECLNYGGNKIWTIDNNYFTEKGSKAYCVKEIDCHLVLKIVESMIDGGRVGIDGTAECYAGGLLKVNNVNVTAQRCDKTTGEFKYTTIQEQETIVKKDTKFVCEYPIDDREAKQQDEINNNSIKYGTIGAATLCIVIIGVVVGVAGRITTKRLEKENREAEQELARINLTYPKWCLSALEKAEYRRKMGRQSESSSIPNEPWKLNKCLTSVKFEAALAYSSEEDGGAASRLDARDKSLVPDDTAEPLLKRRPAKGERAGKNFLEDPNYASVTTAEFKEYADGYSGLRVPYAQKMARPSKK